MTSATPDDIVDSAPPQSNGHVNVNVSRSLDSDSEEEERIVRDENAGNRILVMGSAGVGKKFLVQHLSKLESLNLVSAPLSLTLLPDHPADVTSPSTSHSLPISTTRWSIDTRYYSAHLDFHILTSTHLPVFTPASLLTLQSQLLHPSPSLLLVYDSGDANSFAHIRALTPLISALNRDADGGETVMLIVGNEVKSNTANEQLIQTAKDWAIDNEIEHVTVPFTSPFNNSALVAESKSQERRRWRDGEDEGIPRLSSAFHSNQWLNMRLKDRTATVPNSNLVSSVPPSASSILDSLSREEAAAEAELEAEILASQQRRVAIAEGKIKETAEEEQRRIEEEAFEAQFESDEKMESEMAGFEALFERLSTIRNEARAATYAAENNQANNNNNTTTNSLSDAERRRRAEEAIMAVLRGMGLEEEEGD